MSGALRPNEPLINLGVPTSELTDEEKLVDHQDKSLARIAESADFDVLRERWAGHIENFRTGRYLEGKNQMTDEELGKAFRYEAMIADFLESELSYIDACKASILEGEQGEGTRE